MPSRDELRKQAADIFVDAHTHGHWTCIHECLDHEKTGSPINQLMSLIDQQIREARINEVHNFGNWNADKGIPELWTAIENRIAELSTKPLERKQ